MVRALCIKMFSIIGCFRAMANISDLILGQFLLLSHCILRHKHGLIAGGSGGKPYVVQLEKNTFSFLFL